MRDFAAVAGGQARGKGGKAGTASGGGAGSGSPSANPYTAFIKTEMARLREEQPQLDRRAALRVAANNVSNEPEHRTASARARAARRSCCEWSHTRRAVRLARSQWALARRPNGATASWDPLAGHMAAATAALDAAQHAAQAAALPAAPQQRSALSGATAAALTPLVPVPLTAAPQHLVPAAAPDTPEWAPARGPDGGIALLLQPRHRPPHHVQGMPPSPPRPATTPPSSGAATATTALPAAQAAQPPHPAPGDQDAALPQHAPSTPRRQALMAASRSVASLPGLIDLLTHSLLPTLQPPPSAAPPAQPAPPGPVGLAQGGALPLPAQAGDPDGDPALALLPAPGSEAAMPWQDLWEQLEQAPSLEQWLLQQPPQQQPAQQPQQQLGALAGGGGGAQSAAHQVVRRASSILLRDLILAGMEDESVEQLLAAFGWPGAADAAS